MTILFDIKHIYHCDQETILSRVSCNNLLLYQKGILVNFGPHSTNYDLIDNIKIKKTNTFCWSDQNIKYCGQKIVTLTFFQA